MKPRDSVGGYRGSGDGATMRPPAPLPSASMGQPNGRTEAPYDVLQPREALLEAARLNRRTLDLVAESNQDGGTQYDWALLEQAAQLAAVAHSLAAYAEAGRWTP